MRNISENPITWEVYRIDDNGIEFVVRAGLSASMAANLCEILTKRGHKQVYGVRQCISGL